MTKNNAKKRLSRNKNHDIKQLRTGNQNTQSVQYGYGSHLVKLEKRRPNFLQVYFSVTYNIQILYLFVM